MSNAKKPVWPPPKLLFTTPTMGRCDTRRAFDVWYEEYITSLGPVEEVGGSIGPEGCVFSRATQGITHTALLIGVTPVRKETADELLAELILNWPGSSRISAYEKAKEYLARKKAGQK